MSETTFGVYRVNCLLYHQQWHHCWENEEAAASSKRCCLHILQKDDKFSALRIFTRKLLNTACLILKCSFAERWRNSAIKGVSKITNRRIVSRWFCLSYRMPAKFKNWIYFNVSAKYKTARRKLESSLTFTFE